MKAALGLIETLGLTAAITALDAAGKAADVSLVGYEKVIGAGQGVSVTIHLGGEVAAVKASVEAGVTAASRVGTVLSHHVIPRPHEEMDRLIKAFEKNLKSSTDRANHQESSERQKKATRESDGEFKK